MLLLSGDIQPNPGPAAAGVRNTKYPSTVCGRGVRSNCKAVSCDVCQLWTHVNCCDVSLEVYNDSVNNGTPLSHVCDVCLIGELPIINNFNDEANQTVFHSNTKNIAPDLNNSTDVPDQYELFTKKGLHFLHINARSLLPKLSVACLLVRRTKAAVLAVTETWLDDSVTNAEIEIDGYIVHRRDRNRHGGGVCLFTMSDIAFNPEPDLSTDDLESLCVNILLPKTKPILVGVCYRPPTQFNFYKLLEESLETVFPNTEFILLGDFNTALSNKNMTCFLVKELYNFSSMLGLSQLIDCATRVTCQCSSILDLIFVSVPDNVTQSGVLSVGFSDHLVIYCTLKVKKIKLGTHKSIKIRSLKKYDKTMFN